MNQDKQNSETKRNDALESASKFLSYILRHRPDSIGIQLDSQGWAQLDELIEKSNTEGRRLSHEMIQQIVAENDKQRFVFSDDGQRIRANQGHSVEAVDLQMPAAKPPAVLYHGTVARFVTSIRQHGLIAGARHHVHLSADRENAVQVGSRRGPPIILAIHTAEMYESGHSFYLSANGVWLTESVPPTYIDFPLDA